MKETKAEKSSKRIHPVTLLLLVILVLAIVVAGGSSSSKEAPQPATKVSAISDNLSQQKQKCVADAQQLSGIDPTLADGAWLQAQISACQVRFAPSSSPALQTCVYNAQRSSTIDPRLGNGSWLDAQISACQATN